MSPAAVVLIVLTAAAFPLLLWAIGRVVTAMGERAPHSGGRSRHYLAGRLHGVRITALMTTANRPGPAAVPHQRRR